MLVDCRHMNKGSYLCVRLLQLQGGVLSQGYTQYMIEHLQEQRGFLLKNEARTLGGAAVLRCRAGKPQVRERHKCDVILPVLIKYGCFCGLSTSGVEQSFSKFAALSAQGTKVHAAHYSGRRSVPDAPTRLLCARVALAAWAADLA